jgi:hypothetical protein
MEEIDMTYYEMIVDHEDEVPAEAWSDPEICIMINRGIRLKVIKAWGQLCLRAKLALE